MRPALHYCRECCTDSPFLSFACVGLEDFHTPSSGDAPEAADPSAQVSCFVYPEIRGLLIIPDIVLGTTESC